jgi:anti-sigma factor RsiW
MATELDDDTLQRFYDGELSPLEERTVRAMIEQDPAAQARLSRLKRLSEMFTLAAEDMGAELDSAALFSGIQADIKQQETLGLGERLRVITFEWVEHKRGAVISLGAVAAIAAAALFAVITPDRHDENQARTMPRPREEQKLRLAEAPAQHGSQIENVDFGRNTGTVFEVENEGVTTAVVWIADEEEDMP